MRQYFTAAFLAALASAAPAQEDKIFWTDGTVTNGVKVQDFTWDKIVYRKGGQIEQRSADTVADLEIAKVAETYRRGYNADNKDNAYNAFLAEADRLAKNDPFLAQFGYIEAARLLRTNGQYGEAFALLKEKIAEQLPDSGFLPDVFRFRLEYYLGRGKDAARDAAQVAKEYRDTAVQKGWPNGFVHEADYYGLMVQATDGALSGSALEGQLEGLLNKTEGSYPQVADRIKVSLANAHRKDNQIAEARQLYQSLAENSADPETRAEARLGLGHISLAEGDATNTEPFREALLAFLRVYLESPEASDAVRAEALYHAALAAEKWRGPDSGAMARRLRGLLRRDFADSSWASR